LSGQWTGRTSQGTAIAFTVSANRITGVRLDYSCSGGGGGLTIPADASLLIGPGATFATVFISTSGPVDVFRAITVRFIFRSARNANGIVEFANDRACGTSEATWTAARQP